MGQTDVSSISLLPNGHLICPASSDPVAKAFAKSEAEGLLALLEGTGNPAAEDPSLGFWREVMSAFVRAVCHVPEGSGTAFELPEPDAGQLSEWVLNAPPMTGGEYLTPDVLRMLWQRLERWTREQVETRGGIAAWLEHDAPSWSRVGRVTVHLAENKGDADYPFAFMASYASGLTTGGRLRQLPLGKALQEYGSANDKAVLLKLLEPLHRASQSCPLMAELVDSGDVYHPLAWTPAEARGFLQSIPAYEDAGLLVRMPNWW